MAKFNIHGRTYKDLLAHYFPGESVPTPPKVSLANEETPGQALLNIILRNNGESTAYAAFRAKNKDLLDKWAKEEGKHWKEVTSERFNALTEEEKQQFLEEAKEYNLTEDVKEQ